MNWACSSRYKFADLTCRASSDEGIVDSIAFTIGGAGCGGSWVIVSWVQRRYLVHCGQWWGNILGLRYKLLTSSVANSCKWCSHVTRALVQGIEHLKIGISVIWIVNPQRYVCQHTHEYPVIHVACAIVNRAGTLGARGRRRVLVPLLHTHFWGNQIAAWSAAYLNCQHT